MSALRRAVRNDLAAIIALQHAAYAKNRPLLGVEPLPLLADYAEIFPRYEFYVVEGVTALDGVLILEPRAGDLLIWSIAVAPHAQGRGVGNKMLTFADARARELGVPSVRLYTGAPLAFNIAWYTRHGYTHERTEDMGDRVAVHLIKHL